MTLPPNSSGLRVVGDESPVWMTKRQVAEHLQVSTRTVDKRRSDRGLPFTNRTVNACSSPNAVVASAPWRDGHASPDVP